MLVKRTIKQPAVKDSTSKKEKASGWARSTFSMSNLNKHNKVGLLSKVAEIRIPSDEVVPRPDVGLRVLFLSFL
jgi:hypothetical protein